MGGYFHEGRWHALELSVALGQTLPVWPLVFSSVGGCKAAEQDSM